MATHPAVTHVAAHHVGKTAGKHAVKDLMARTGGHPGWKRLARALAKDKGITIERANRMIGKTYWNASSKAIANNPNLLHGR